MSDEIVADLERRMAEAVAAEDYEAAADLRDAIEAFRSGGAGSKLRRTAPGAMGLGTSDPAYKPPEGWVRPTRPSPMTGSHKPRGGKR
jgi:hypothetical protein